MYRPVLASPSYSYRWREIWARFLALLTLWIFSVSLRFGYGNSHLVLGPNSSRLFKASSFFVEQIQVRDYAKKGVLLYEFSEKPELSLETNWNVSSFLTVSSYSRRGFSLWLNKGSRIHMRWAVPTSSVSHLLVILIKGEKIFDTLLPKSTNPLNAVSVSNPTKGIGEVEYVIEEDDSYYIGVVNMNPRSIVMAMNVNVSSKMYDTTKAKSICSTINGLCRLKLPFPNTRFVILTTPNNGGLEGWDVELSFAARLIAYVAIIGFIVIIISLILKYLGACDGDTTVEEVLETETVPLLQEKEMPFIYGTGEEDTESGMRSGSSDDLYDGKICVICYEEQRNCFFVPCGHCATCYSCAQRIAEGENKVCPICRRIIHKVRQLLIPSK
ncbi:hypothetical protein HHK36_030989 [Tetracentron sinense]|uniref:RING-type domain-containing protein n=1 Tax=Tetracentron sinense TaxID=13715 RepID=A0A835CZ62_TETSI|nr:hypothetical protein HHK36_030989 [Tetracentron sinense]